MLDETKEGVFRIVEIVDGLKRNKKNKNCQL
jgi:hypothetical protein